MLVILVFKERWHRWTQHFSCVRLCRLVS